MTKLTIPSQSPSGVIKPSKYSRGLVMQAAEMIGGLERLAEQADEDPKWFFEKIFVRLMAPEKEEQKEETIAEIIAKLDERMIDVTPVKEAKDE